MPSGHAQVPSELTEGLEIGETEESEGIAVQRLPFERTDYQGTGEALANPHGLRQVEVPTARPRSRSEPCELLFIHLPHPVAVHQPGLMKPTQNDQCAHLEAAREARALIIQGRLAESQVRNVSGDTPSKDANRCCESCSRNRRPRISVAPVIGGFRVIVRHHDYLESRRESRRVFHRA
jgi:hypothetical protein